MERKLERLLKIAEKCGVPKFETMEAYFYATKEYGVHIEKPPKPNGVYKDFNRMSEEWYNRCVHHSQRVALQYIRENRTK